MDRRNFLPLRSLPRVFLSDIPTDFSPIPLPEDEYQKFHKVLRLGRGDQIAIVSGDGRILRCELDGRTAIPLEESFPDTEPKISLTLVQALPKQDKLEHIVRLSTEIGVSRFVVFPSDRSVVRWDAKKLKEKLNRLKVIARESAELSYRMQLPDFLELSSLQEVLLKYPSAYVLDECEDVDKKLAPAEKEVIVVVGPEGGWSPRESKLIGDRGVTLGPRVFRVETAAVAACAKVLLAEQ